MTTHVHYGVVTAIGHVSHFSSSQQIWLATAISHWTLYGPCAVVVVSPAIFILYSSQSSLNKHVNATQNFELVVGY
jgi:hypothetical protein